ncbi:hypothetical protein BDU57DRAFT_65078 [Ampelomyces quisqualis]|uniref:Uncharacterized protein n=1 Tax=Ampelomyces quisqualis TaxID=50730 RepID=A0A6A5R3A2_AMPQU|nr:hypothetical protein BDU57DRAFT_65078 [Ampelomyces quisqualis]
MSKYRAITLPPSASSYVTALLTSTRHPHPRHPHKHSWAQNHTQSTIPTTSYPPAEKMAGPRTPPPLQSDSTSTNTDSNATPRPKRQTLRVTLRPPPPHRRSSSEPLYHDNDGFEEQEQLWREHRPPLPHAPPARDEENGLSERDKTRREREEDEWRRREDVDLDDWTEWIGIWLLTCMVMMALAGAAAVLWILVTQ